MSTSGEMQLRDLTSHVSDTDGKTLRPGAEDSGASSGPTATTSVSIIAASRLELTSLLKWP